METIQNCWWQIIVAAIVYFALGAVWFNPKVLGSLWAASHGIKITDDDKAKANMMKIMSLGFICTVLLCAAICLACGAAWTGVVHADGTAVSDGVMHILKGGLLVGGVASLGITISYLYQMKPTNAYLTDCGYHVVGSLLAAFVLHLLGCC